MSVSARQAPWIGRPAEDISADAVERPDEAAALRIAIPDEVPAARDASLLPALRPRDYTARQYRWLYRAMGATDVASVATALVAAALLGHSGHVGTIGLIAMAVISPLLVLPIFVGLRLYAIHQLAPAEEFRRVILGVSVVVMALFTVSAWTGSLSRTWMGIAALLSVALLVFSRRIWHFYLFKARQQGKLTFRTVVVGTNDEANRLREVLSTGPFGFQPVGFIETWIGKERRATPRIYHHPQPEWQQATTRKLPELPVLGTMEGLRRVIRETSAECVFVASSAVRVDHMTHLAKLARQEGVEFRVTSCLPEVLSTRLAVQPLGGVMALSVKPVRLTGTQAAAKRAFDLVAASLGLLVSAPLWAAIALAIKVTSPGPVLFKQARVGRRGREFKVYKFRTMVRGAEAMLEDVRDQNEADGPLFKLKTDPRVTRVGAWLRRWSLDEVPQLLNVVRGEMSLVGPRPPLPDEVAEYEDWHLDRLEVHPGMTGLWQVKGRSDVSFDEYVRLDLFYIENWSLAYDLFILLTTAKAVLSRKGAY
jgi:exopolysaccharide biosynthesis polyprenyl glycosylphosphotransferase